MRLFSDASLRDVLEQQKKNLVDEIEKMPPADLLKADEAKLREALVADYTLDAPVLRVFRNLQE